MLALKNQEMHFFNFRAYNEMETENIRKIHHALVEGLSTPKSSCTGKGF